MSLVTIVPEQQGINAGVLRALVFFLKFSYLALRPVPGWEPQGTWVVCVKGVPETALADHCHNLSSVW